jgi:hypothetical protein
MKAQLQQYPYNDWRHPRDMTLKERERLMREYEKRTGKKICS